MSDPIVSGAAIDRRPARTDAPVDPILARALPRLLWLWDTLGLELGEGAVVTDGHPWSRAAALVAVWYGAHPVLLVTPGETLPAGVTPFRAADDPAEAVKALAGLLQPRPGVAIAELSGRADLVDLVFEGIPPGARVMLGGAAVERLTIDFYVNVHRKGILLASALFEPEAAPAPGWNASAYAERASRILADAARAAALGEALAVPSQENRP